MFDLKEFLLLPTWICLRMLQPFSFAGNTLKKSKLPPFKAWCEEATDTSVVFGFFVLVSMAMFMPGLHALLGYVL